MKTNLLKYYIAAFYFCSTFVLMANPGTEDETGPGNLEGPEAVAPIDDYVLVLAIIGLLLVFYKFRAIQKQDANSQV